MRKSSLLVVAFVFVIKYQATVCLATSTVYAFSHVAFGIVSFSSPRSGVKVCHLSQTASNTRGGGSDEADGTDGVSSINYVDVCDKPLVNATNLYSKRLQLTMSWSDINTSLQDLDKNITSLFRRSRKDILESVRNKRKFYADSDVRNLRLDDLYQQIQLDIDTSSEQYSDNSRRDNPSYLDRISKSFALFIVLSTNIQVLGKLFLVAVASNSDLADEVCVCSCLCIFFTR